MAYLVVVEKIDGTAVSWRCSDCQQKFSVRGKLTSTERQKIITVEFRAHNEASHKSQPSAEEMAFALAAVPFPD